jgi:hypothetical protein
MKNKFYFCLFICAYVFPQVLRAQSWTPPVIIEEVEGVGADVGMHSSLVVVNGNPAIAYYDATRGNLLFKRALDADGTTWDEVMVLDNANLTGEFPSMKIVNGNPAIAYHEFTSSKLKYIRANDANGTSWGAPIIVENNWLVGEYAHLEVVNGNPAIAFYNSLTGDLMYNRSNDMNGDTWNSSITSYLHWFCRYLSFYGGHQWKSCHIILRCYKCGVALYKINRCKWHCMGSTACA